MTMLRILHLVVAAVLVLAAADVYKIKFDSARQAERLAKLRAETRHEHDAIAALRAEWSELDNPRRVQALAQRYLALKAIEVNQFDSLDRLPDKPIDIVPPGTADPIGAILETFADPGSVTGSIPNPPKAK
jgi:hypothetical protein